MTGKIKSFLGQFGSVYGDTPLTFPQLDIEKIKDRLNLKQLGEDRGNKNLPPADTKALDDIEQRIVTFIEDEVKDSKERYYDNQRSFEDRISKLNSLGYTGKVESIAVLAEGDFENHIHKTKDELYTARRTVTEIENDLNNFKKKNRLDRSARYPESRLWYFAIAAFLLVVETYINGMFFAKGHEMGIVGGFFTAFIPSLLNVSLGCCFGHIAFRLAINCHWLKRTFGLFLCLLMPALIFAVNLATAHYRTAMIGLMGEDAAKIALENLLSAPFMLSDIESWLLFATGCLFSLIATLDFWAMDDHYFHFGKISRHHHQKMEDYANMKAGILEELEEIRDIRLKELDEAYSLVTSRYSEANSIFDAQRRWSVLFKEHIGHLESVGRALLAFYRTNNISARTDKPPKHFQQEWKMERHELPAPSVDFLKILNDFQAESSTAQDIYAKCVNRIGATYHAAIVAYQTIDQLNPEEFNKWLTGTAQDAEKELASAA